MDSIGGILLLLVLWAAWHLAPMGFHRFWEKLNVSWKTSYKNKFKVAIGLFAWMLGCWKITVYFFDIWRGTVFIVMTHSAFFTIYELVSQSRDSAELKLRLKQQEELRQAKLATGEGWSRFDVLRKFKTTLYFRRLGRIETTQGWRCAACSKNLYQERDAEVDHILPISKFPHLKSTESNLQILCRSCNSTKHAYDGDDWKKVVHQRRRARNKRKKDHPE